MRLFLLFLQRAQFILLSVWGKRSFFLFYVRSFLFFPISCIGAACPGTEKSVTAVTSHIFNLSAIVLGIYTNDQYVLHSSIGSIGYINGILLLLPLEQKLGCISSIFCL